MRIAILSDIHANREAFDAVLEVVEKQAADQLVLLGDLVGYGPDPVYVVEKAADLVEAGALCIMGNHDEARRMLAEFEAARSTQVVSAWGIAVLHADLGDIDDAFEWLELALEEHSGGLIVLRVHPRLDSIRSDPRYLPLVKRLGLDDSTGN